MNQRRRSPVSAGCAEPHACPPDVRRRVLAVTPIFAGLDDAALTEVDSAFTSVGVPAGAPVYRAGEPADALLVVASGTVKVSRSDVEGREVLVEVARPGDFLGMLSPLGEPAFPDSATALTTACVLRIDAPDFRGVLRRHPSVAVAALDAVASRLADAHAALRTMAVGSSEERLAATVLRLADRVGVRRPEGLLIDIPLTRSDLAALSGTTTETASRVLSRWREAGWIGTGRAWVAVRERDPLRRLVTG